MAVSVSEAVIFLESDILWKKKIYKKFINSKYVKNKGYFLCI